MQDKELSALLGKGSEFEGKLTFEGSVRIDGTFSGEIFSDGILIIGEGAKVEAEIEVGGIVIHGQVIGNIKATDIIELKNPARLKGNVTTPAFVVEKGVHFDGQCHMGTNEGQATSGARAGSKGSTSGGAPERKANGPNSPASA